jgi:hypothetical protein
MGFRHEFWKEIILFIGLLILLYGFVNAFFGTLPFETLGIQPEFNVFARGTRVGQVLSVAALLLAFLVLVPLRGWYKIRLLEGLETGGQMLVKQVLLWLGVLLLFISRSYPHARHNYSIPQPRVGGKSDRPPQPAGRPCARRQPDAQREQAL